MRVLFCSELMNTSTVKTSILLNSRAASLQSIKLHQFLTVYSICCFMLTFVMLRHLDSENKTHPVCIGQKRHLRTSSSIEKTRERKRIAKILCLTRSVAFRRNASGLKRVFSFIHWCRLKRSKQFRN